MKGETKVSVREKFEGDLSLLQKKLTDLAQFTDSALNTSMEALQTHNVDLALQVIEGDKEADLMYEEINDFAILLIAKQQPVAIDLRRIIVSIKIATDLERIADFAVNIAKSTIRLEKETHIKPINSLKKMYEITSRMMKDSLKAYIEEDLLLAKQVADMDDEVDDLYGAIIKEFFEINEEKESHLAQIMQMLLICRYLERSADHVTNIVEYIFYLVKGKHYDLND
jgi:phosphate transport system protein